MRLINQNELMAISGGAKLSDSGDGGGSTVVNVTINITPGPGQQVAVGSNGQVAVCNPGYIPYANSSVGGAGSIGAAVGTKSIGASIGGSGNAGSNTETGCKSDPNYNPDTSSEDPSKRSNGNRTNQK